MAASSCGRPAVVRTYVSSTYAPFLGAYDRLSCVGNKFCLYACLTSVVRSLRQSYDGRTSFGVSVRTAYVPFTNLYDTVRTQVRTGGWVRTGYAQHADHHVSSRVRTDPVPANVHLCQCRTPYAPGTYHLRVSYARTDVTTKLCGS